MAWPTLDSKVLHGFAPWRFWIWRERTWQLWSRIYLFWWILLDKQKRNRIGLWEHIGVSNLNFGWVQNQDKNVGTMWAKSCGGRCYSCYTLSLQFSLGIYLLWGLLGFTFQVLGTGSAYLCNGYHSVSHWILHWPQLHGNPSSNFLEHNLRWAITGHAVCLFMFSFSILWQCTPSITIDPSKTSKVSLQSRKLVECSKPCSQWQKWFWTCYLVLALLSVLSQLDAALFCRWI